MIVCGPPSGLSDAEAECWRYYAPLLISSRRLTLEARDTLAKYCTALATVADLRKVIASRKTKDVENRLVYRRELRQWLMVSRAYESDLLLNPASAVRAPKPSGDEPDDDPFTQFDDGPPSTH